MNNTAKWLIGIAVVGTIAYVGFRMYKKMQGPAAPKPVPASAPTAAPEAK